MDFEYQEYYRYLHNICLNLTDACNLQCKYCFVEQNPHFMSLETAIAAVEWVNNNAKKREELGKRKNRSSITFFGGEPTLLWDEIIVPVTDYIHKNEYNISLNMTTNGTLLNEERLKWMQQNKIGMLLSMDGDKYTQDFNRPCQNSNLSSFDLVEKNIPLILKYYPDITYRATIYAPTAGHTFENFIYAIKQGFKYTYFLPDYRHDWTDEQIDNLERELDKIYAFIGTCFINGVKPPHFALIDRNFETILRHDIKIKKGTMSKRTEPKTANIIRCGLATTLGSIGYDGSIYGCQEQTSKTVENIFYLGNIFENGIDIECHKTLLSTYSAPHITRCEDETLCLNCPLSGECETMDCPSSRWDLYQDFWIDHKVHCLWNRWGFEKDSVLMKKLVAENNQVFKKYLDEECNFKNYLTKERKD